jgi:hypothetical protein
MTRTKIVLNSMTRLSRTYPRLQHLKRCLLMILSNESCFIIIEAVG